MGKLIPVAMAVVSYLPSTALPLIPPSLHLRPVSMCPLPLVRCIASTLVDRKRRARPIMLRSLVGFPCRPQLRPHRCRIESSSQRTRVDGKKSIPDCET
ncbi:hypothetical protein IWZ01DRAFT_494599, partial [Phyllosticta capitalensis]